MALGGVAEQPELDSTVVQYSSQSRLYGGEETKSPRCESSFLERERERERARVSSVECD